jgi:hypothetical protein
MPISCEAPASPAEAVGWRADTGYPALQWGAVEDAVRALLEAHDREGCFTADDSSPPPVWSGSCTLASGYAVEVDGPVAEWGGDGSSGLSIDWTFTIAATDAADGSLPEGVFAVSADWSSSDSGGSVVATATWEVTDPGPQGLAPTGSFSFSRGESYGGCNGAQVRSTGTLDGCPFDNTLDNYSYKADPGVAEVHTIHVGDWQLSVVQHMCGSIEATLGAGRSFVDPAWLPVTRTDRDGDGCAVEDCDCDDADASIYTGAADDAGDGIDQDCTGGDGDYFEDCADVWRICVLPADSGGGDSGGSDSAMSDSGGADTAPGDTAAETGDTRTTAGGTSCDTGTAGPSGWLAALLPLLRRRRERPEPERQRG